VLFRISWAHHFEVKVFFKGGIHFKDVFLFDPMCPKPSLFPQKANRKITGEVSHIPFFRAKCAEPLTARAQEGLGAVSAVLELYLQLEKPMVEKVVLTREVLN
jgi:hypothetical protein